MKILLVITSLGVGGAEKVVTSLADDLIREGHNVTIVCLLGDPVVAPESKNVKVITLGMKSKLDVFRAFKALYQVINSFKPDVVHSHLIHANIMCRLLRILIEIPRLITTAHNTNEEGRMRMLAYRATDFLTDISTNVSQEAVEAFISQGAVKMGRMICLHNGINTEYFQFNEESRLSIRKEFNIDATQKVILAVGRLNEQKDYPNLINSINKMKNSKAILIIVGDGVQKQELELLTESLNLSSRVVFMGIRHDIPSLMSAADVFVLSSAWEGFGLVVAEAMACEKVVVATDCGGVKEVVGENGILVPIKDSVVLANALDGAIELAPDISENIGMLARRRIISNYSVSSSTTKYLKLYSCSNSALRTVSFDQD